MKAVLLVEAAGVPVLFQHPQCHGRETTASEFGKNVIDESAAVAVSPQLRQDVQRRDVADASGIIVRVSGWNHLAERNAFVSLFDYKDRPFVVGNTLGPESGSISEIG